MNGFPCFVSPIAFDADACAKYNTFRVREQTTVEECIALHEARVRQAAYCDRVMAQVRGMSQPTETDLYVAWTLQAQRKTLDV